MMPRKGLSVKQLEFLTDRMALDEVIRIRLNDGKPKVESFVDAPATPSSHDVPPDNSKGALRIPDEIPSMTLEKHVGKEFDDKKAKPRPSVVPFDDKKAMPRPSAVPQADIPGNSLDDGTESAVNIGNVDSFSFSKTLAGVRTAMEGGGTGLAFVGGRM
jgi:hypothetical protein